MIFYNVHEDTQKATLILSCTNSEAQKIGDELQSVVTDLWAIDEDQIYSSADIAELQKFHSAAESYELVQRLGQKFTSTDSVGDSSDNNESASTGINDTHESDYDPDTYDDNAPIF